MQNQKVHHWIIAPYQADRQQFWQVLKQQETHTYKLDCHQNLRGPYSGCGELFRLIVPGIYRQQPEIVKAHAIEILSVAPELKMLITVETETLTSLAIPEERTRFYGRARTLRIAHGLVDFLRKCIGREQTEHYVLFFENVHAADSLDREFLEVLLRRVPAQEIAVIIGTNADALPESFAQILNDYTEQIQLAPSDEFLQFLQSNDIPLDWQQWLLRYCTGWHGERQTILVLCNLLAQNLPQCSSFQVVVEDLLEHALPALRLKLACAYVATDATTDSIEEISAYRQLDPVVRQRLHDEHAAELEQLQQWSLHLGAIPYHREHGQIPQKAGAQALQAALDYCINMGYYEATIALAYRGRKVIDWKEQSAFYWTFTTKATTSLAALERAEEAEQLYNEARALFCDAGIHMQCAYATAMLYTRHHRTERRDFTIAKGWMNEAIGIAQLLRDPKENAFATVFNQNGLALIEVRMGQPQEALRLVSEGLARLNRELEPGEHMLHRSVLLYNRAQVYVMLGKLEQALDDYTAVIAQDPYYSEYYFERGGLYRRLGREQEALHDYERAIQYSPPYPEAYYNRATVLLALRREQEALDDYSYVLELDPKHIDALINRSSIYYERGAYEQAQQDVLHGLTFQPTHAQFLCTKGLLAMAEEHYTEADQAFTAALEQDPKLVAAWSNRAILAFERGDNAPAISDLTHALAPGENATVRYNRGLAYQAQAQWQEAIDDFSHVLSLNDSDSTKQDALYQRGFCYIQIGEHKLAQQDFAALLSQEGNSPYVEEIHKFEAAL
jgi:tetratricopeptide (TPR) repeat protein